MREDLYRMKQLQQHADTKTATVRIVFVVFRHSNKPAPISVQWHDLKERNKNAEKELSTSTSAVFHSEWKSKFVLRSREMIVFHHFRAKNKFCRGSNVWLTAPCRLLSQAISTVSIHDSKAAFLWEQEEAMVLDSPTVFLVLFPLFFTRILCADEHWRRPSAA